MFVTCNVSSCVHNDGDGGCNSKWGVTISDDQCTAAGFLPICQDYKEKVEEQLMSAFDNYDKDLNSNYLLSTCF